MTSSAWSPTDGCPTDGCPNHGPSNQIETIPDLAGSPSPILVIASSSLNTRTWRSRSRNEGGSCGIWNALWCTPLKRVPVPRKTHLKSVVHRPTRPDSATRARSKLFVSAATPVSEVSSVAVATPSGLLYA